MPSRMRASTTSRAACEKRVYVRVRVVGSVRAGLLLVTVNAKRSVPKNRRRLLVMAPVTLLAPDV
jgi:hypothetical protein